MATLAFNKDPNQSQVNTIRGYYRWHAKVYEATRWLFLFGRKRIVDALQLPLWSDKTVVEVGCGTGHNLRYLARKYKGLRLIGVDISSDMLSVAAQKLKRFARRVLFLEKSYVPGKWKLPEKPDVVLASYCLTMINPGWEATLQRAADDLKEDGTIAVVDFYGSPFSFFRRWIGHNHVRMEQHLLYALEKHFKPVQLEVREAYGGLWTYFMFVGKKWTDADLLEEEDCIPE